MYKLTPSGHRYFITLVYDFSRPYYLKDIHCDLLKFKYNKNVCKLVSLQRPE